LCDEFKVDQSAMATNVFLESPLRTVIQDGLVFNARTEDEELCRKHPLIADFAKEGFKHYIAAPLSTNGNSYNAISVATRDPAGFTPEHIGAFKRIGRPLALLVDRFIGNRIARNVMDVYLGSVVGKKVLTGSIGRGDGDAMKAIIWASDMSGFTHYADNLSPPDVLALLNAYFECVAGAVTAHGGEVLKFIGDGLLAVFPLEDGNDSAVVAQASLAAALRARQNIAELNRAPPQELTAAYALGPLRSGIALHEGGVFFGNMGSPNRLDFTVIGRAVNAASRIEALTKTLGRDILITEPVAARLNVDLDDLGAHPLRGLDEPLRLFSPRSVDGP
jgi:adenylate cyclase